MSPENYTANAGGCPAKTILLPAGFDAKDHLPGWLHRHAPRASWLIHRIRTGAIREGEHRWLSLSHAHMEQEFGNHRTWGEVRRAYLGSGVWGCDNVAIQGEKSFWYRLLPPWSDRDLVRHTLADDAVVREIALSERRRREREGWSEVHFHLERILSGVRIDREAAAGALASLGDDRRREALDQIDNFDLGDPRCIRDPHGRFHSPLTRLPRTLRPSLRFRGLSFASLDVSSCQPFLLGLSCLPWFDPEGIGREEGGGLLLRTSSLHTTGRQLSDVDPGLADYLTACSENRYYAEFAAMKEMPFGEAKEKEAVKEASCIALYGKRGPGRAFVKRWRVVADRLAELKRPGYEKAAHTLQRIESKLMIEGVCGDLMREHPDLPVLTIHDCVLAPTDAIDIVRAAIQRRFGCFGFPVHLK